MSIGLAIRAFIAVLSNRELAQRVAQLLQPENAPAQQPEAAVETRRGSTGGAGDVNGPARPTSQREVAARSDALTLLSTLQREARLLDLVAEPLDGYSDVQIGAAAREVIRDCRKSLDRIFAIAPLDDRSEGSVCEVASSSAIRTRIIGNVTGAGDTGVITHRGWKASQCALPTWTGASEDRWVLAPVEIEVSSHASR